MNKDTLFPQYRKLINERVFYKISSDRCFEEVQLVGSKKMIYTTNANQYPEILKIKDMLELSETMYLDSSKEEWDKINS